MSDKATYEKLEQRVRELEKAESDRKQAEEALKESDRTLRQALDGLPFNIAMLDKQSNIIFINTAWRRFAECNGGIDEAVLHGTNYLEVCDKAAYEGDHIARLFADNLRRVIEGKLPSFELEYPCHSPMEKRWFIGSASRIGDGLVNAVVSHLNITEQKQVEVELKESEQKYRTVFENIQDVYAEVAADGTVLEVSPSITPFSGYSREEVIGHSLVEFFTNPEELSGLWETLRRESCVNDYEVRLRHRNGSERVCSFTVKTIEKAYEGVDKIVGTMRDITERKQASASIQQAKERTETILQTIQSGVFVIDAETRRILDVNRAAEEMIGTNKDNIIGHVCHQFVCPRNKNDCPINDRSQKVDNSETVLLRKDGSEREILKTVASVTIEDRECYIESFVDISERKQAEESAHTHHERLKLFFSSIQDAIFVHPLLGKGFAPFVEVNDIACKRYGYSREEFLKLTAPDITKKGDAISHASSNHRKKLLDTKHLIFEATHIKSTGEEFPVEINSNIFKQSGKPMILAVVRDISERKQAEKEKESLQLQLLEAQKLEAIGTLAGGVAHDFNNILSAILGYSELALHELDASPTVKNKLEAIHRSGLRARDLVSQILAFSRKEEHVRTVLDLDFIIKDALKLLRPAIPTNIVIETQVSSKCRIIGDQSRIYQIIMNLGTNAYQAMLESGGTLSISLTREEMQDDAARIAQVPVGEYVKLKVSDTGIGIPPENISRIFDPYFTTKEKGKGTGLGLAAVHGIVKSHGGGVIVESQIGQGTTFEVYLPLTSEMEGKEQTGTYPLRGGSERILLVDDEPDILEVETEMLKRLGYQLKTAGNASEALKLFTKQPDQFDLVITDMTMPGMSGDKLAGEVQKMRSGIPIILCTGYSEVISNEKAQSLGISGFLMKPVLLSDISKMIRRVLDEAKS
jgi:PAS domain S-box-containing protein